MVAIDPRTGAILAMVSTPSYDPNPLVSHDTERGQAAYNKLDKDPDKPLLNRALSETYPPGSTFKVIVSAAALRERAARRTPTLTGGASYSAPDTTHTDPNAPGVDLPGDQITLQGGADRLLQHRLRPARRRELGADKLKTAAHGVRLRRPEPDRRPARRATACRWRASHTGQLITSSDGGDRPAARWPSRASASASVRMTPLQGAHDRGGGRQQRPADAAVPGRSSCSGPDLTHDSTGRPRRRCASPSAPRWRRSCSEMMDSVVRERHRHQRADRRLSRSAARPERRRTARRAGPRLVHRLRAARTASRSSAVACSWRMPAPAAAARPPGSRVRS